MRPIDKHVAVSIRRPRSAVPDWTRLEFARVPLRSVKGDAVAIDERNDCMSRTSGQAPLKIPRLAWEARRGNSVFLALSSLMHLSLDGPEERKRTTSVSSPLRLLPTFHQCTRVHVHDVLVPLVFARGKAERRENEARWTTRRGRTSLKLE